MIIPGFLVSLVTFPGIIVHEMAHQLFCRLCRVAVLDVCYFRLGNPAGYVLHETPKKALQQIAIGIGPFLVNSVVAAVVALPAALPALKFGAGSPVDWVLVWLSVSIGMHAFPSSGDAKSLWQAAWAADTPRWVGLLVTPLVGLIYLGAIGSVFWLDGAYGLAIVALAPDLLVSLIA